MRASNAGIITKRETQILYAIAEHIKHRGYPPTYREIKDTTGLRSTSTINLYVERLSEKGCLNHVAGSPRALTLTDKGHRVVRNITVMPTVDPAEEYEKWKLRRATLTERRT